MVNPSNYRAVMASNEEPTIASIDTMNIPYHSTRIHMNSGRLLKPKPVVSTT